MGSGLGDDSICSFTLENPFLCPTGYKTGKSVEALASQKTLTKAGEDPISRMLGNNGLIIVL